MSNTDEIVDEFLKSIVLKQVGGSVYLVPAIADVQIEDFKEKLRNAKTDAEQPTVTVTGYGIIFDDLPDASGNVYKKGCFDVDGIGSIKWSGDLTTAKPLDFKIEEDEKGLLITATLPAKKEAKNG